MGTFQISIAGGGSFQKFHELKSSCKQGSAKRWAKAIYKMQFLKEILNITKLTFKA